MRRVLAIGLAMVLSASISVAHGAERKAASVPQTNTGGSATELLKVPKGAKTGAHNPAGEDSRGLFQINIDPKTKGRTYGDLTDLGKRPRNQKLRPGQTLEVRITKPSTSTARPQLKKP